MNEPKISEMAINVKVKFSEAIASTDKVLENIRQALLRQVEELGISPSDEEGAVENIVFEYQGQEVFVYGTKTGYKSKLLTDKEYQRLSRLFFSTTESSARLFRENPGTAELMKRADKYRESLKSLDYESFCTTLSLLSGTPQPFSVDGISANWNVVYHYINNSQESVKWLFEILEAANTIVDLPISPEIIEGLNISEETKNELTGKGLAISWFNK